WLSVAAGFRGRRVCRGVAGSTELVGTVLRRGLFPLDGVARLVPYRVVGVEAFPFADQQQRLVGVSVFPCFSRLAGDPCGVVPAVLPYGLDAFAAPLLEDGDAVAVTVGEFRMMESSPALCPVPFLSRHRRVSGREGVVDALHGVSGGVAGTRVEHGGCQQRHGLDQFGAPFGGHARWGRWVRGFRGG